jgi:hypothetical protein
MASGSMMPSIVLLAPDNGPQVARTDWGTLAALPHSKHFPQARCLPTRMRDEHIHASHRNKYQMLLSPEVNPCVALVQALYRKKQTSASCMSTIGKGTFVFATTGASAPVLASTCRDMERGSQTPSPCARAAKISLPLMRKYPCETLVLQNTSPLRLQTLLRAFWLFTVGMGST